MSQDPEEAAEPDIEELSEEMQHSLKVHDYDCDWEDVRDCEGCNVEATYIMLNIVSNRIVNWTLFFRVHS